MNIPLLTRAEFLGQIMQNYHTAIGVSGTHGKTTTTSMLSQIMLEADTDPTILVGGIMPAIKGNTRIVILISLLLKHANILTVSYPLSQQLPLF